MVLIIFSEFSNLDCKKSIETGKRLSLLTFLVPGLENAALACSLLRLLPGSQIWTFLVAIHHISDARKPIAKKEMVEKDKALKEWRQAFKGQCRAPRHIPKKGGMYKMCPQ